MADISMASNLNIIDPTNDLESSQYFTQPANITNAHIASTLDDDDDIEDLFEKNTESFRCLAQVLISRSSVFGHLLYNFDPPTDPGIEEAFASEDDQNVFLDTVGIQTYKNHCKEFEIVPISRVIKSLPTDTLDLSYYGLSVKQIKSLAGALVFNRHVENVILDENILDSEAVYHISELLRDNYKISYLSLKNCWIGPIAIKKLSEGIFTTQLVTELDLSYNDIKSSGLASLAGSLRNNMSIRKLNLSHNGLDGGVGKTLGRALAENDCLVDLDLSWNNLNSLEGLLYLCKGLTVKDNILVLNLSWNGISTKESLNPIIKYMKATRVLEHLDLSNNQMQGVLISLVRSGILGNSSLISVNMSSNIFTPEESSSLARVFTADRGGVKEPLKLKYLDLENIYVEKSLIPYWRNLTTEGKFIKFEGIFSNYEIVGPDVKKVLFDRVRYLSQKPKSKKARKEFGHFLYGIDKGTQLGNTVMIPDPNGMVKADFLTALKKFKMAKVYKDPDLLKEIITKYTNSKDKINTSLMRKEYYNYYPDTTIPEEKKNDGKKGKSKKGKAKGAANKDVNDDVKELPHKLRIDESAMQLLEKKPEEVRVSIAASDIKSVQNELLTTDKHASKSFTSLGDDGSRKTEKSKSILKK